MQAKDVLIDALNVQVQKYSICSIFALLYFFFLHFRVTSNLVLVLVVNKSASFGCNRLPSSLCLNKKYLVPGVLKDGYGIAS